MKVFICGPLRAGTRDEIRSNIKRAEHLQQVLLEKGYAVFCPHVEYGRFFFGVYPEVEILDKRAIASCKEYLLASDIIYVMEGYHDSKGSRAEIILAGENGIAIAHSIEQLEKIKKKYYDSITTLVGCIFCDKGIRPRDGWVCNECKDKVPAGWEVAEGSKRLPKKGEFILRSNNLPIAFKTACEYKTWVEVILRKKEHSL